MCNCAFCNDNVRLAVKDQKASQGKSRNGKSILTTFAQLLWIWLFNDATLFLPSCTRTPEHHPNPTDTRRRWNGDYSRAPHFVVASNLFSYFFPCIEKLSFERLPSADTVDWYALKWRSSAELRSRKVGLVGSANGERLSSHADNGQHFSWNECHTWPRRSWCDNGNRSHWKSIPMKNANAIASRHSYFEAHYIMWLILKLISKARNFSASQSVDFTIFFPFRIAYEKNLLLEGNEITAQLKAVAYGKYVEILFLDSHRRRKVDISDDKRKAQSAKKLISNAFFFSSRRDNEWSILDRWEALLRRSSRARGEELQHVWTWTTSSETGWNVSQLVSTLDGDFSTSRLWSQF